MLMRRFFSRFIFFITLFFPNFYIVCSSVVRFGTKTLKQKKVNLEQLKRNVQTVNFSKATSKKTGNIELFYDLAKEGLEFKQEIQAKEKTIRKNFKKLSKNDPNIISIITEAVEDPAFLVLSKESGISADVIQEKYSLFLKNKIFLRKK